ncbi:type-F conjugative transfer system secretin TraK (plasmid) [Legionella lytica]|uniref:Type-F conjugative transfer system secretin TraK n=1 Tax=Legionella lytica TaxID=96232 RepID=A0ABY4YDS3_9GAMM|nr:type-F conjugative transfer system secretin TraK [Legionella lytica]USQ15572.1 type-F conjugative transfer system secretin TraK [Legionella lytica]
MVKKLKIALILFSMNSFAQTAVPVANNGEISLSLSANNYNRILIKDDEIWDFAFPPGALGIQQDKGDHSVYVLPVRAPVTLFITTKLGRHYSLTVNTEDSLGKTIELIPKEPVPVLAKESPVKKPEKVLEEEVPQAITSLLSHMEQHKPFTDVAVKRHFGRVERWNRGLTLQINETWEGKELLGEAITLRNGGKHPLQLAQDWFVKDGTLAVKFSKSTIAPGETATLYRIQGVGHG